MDLEIILWIDRVSGNIRVTLVASLICEGNYDRMSPKFTRRLFETILNLIIFPHTSETFLAHFHWGNVRPIKT